MWALLTVDGHPPTTKALLPLCLVRSVGHDVVFVEGNERGQFLISSHNVLRRRAMLAHVGSRASEVRFMV